MNALSLFRCLRNPIFARLYIAQTTSLLGDALTWVGLALLTFELVGKNSAVVLSGALTLRVTAFVLLSPLAGAIADRLDRKRIMVVTHLARMLFVGLLPFVTAVWQVYLLIFALNIFNAFFTPTYKATIPQVTGQNDYPQAIALSSVTYQLLSVLGPGFAGAIAAFIGARQIFFLDALSFVVAAILIFSLPGQMRVDSSQPSMRTTGRTWQDIKAGTTRLFVDAPIRYALLMQLVASIAGAQILVNTVSYVQGTLKLGDVQYGWVMAAFGIGAAVSAVVVSAINRRLALTSLMLMGAASISLALMPANFVGLAVLMMLWAVAGAGQNLVDLPTQTLIADRIPRTLQGRVYRAHFAWSHLWWAISYPLAGWMGSYFGDRSFLYGSLVSLGLLALVQVTVSPQLRDREHIHYPTWHKHEHLHDEHHQHDHEPGILTSEPHTHLHEHTIVLYHSHPQTIDLHHRHYY